MAERVLKPHGHALIKVPEGAGFEERVEAVRGKFARVKLQKPATSRSRSAAMYLLATDFRLV
jgi:23S rRNA (uridine2552-2'-O)-methyltransferase